MRDKRFVAVHRGGPFTKTNHHKLIRWARECSEHVLSLAAEPIDPRLIYALKVAKEWEYEKVTTGEAVKASLGAHAAARESSDPVAIAVARSVGQAVATAHMADHSMGAALYALKAVSLAGKSVDKEREWQNKHLLQLPMEIVELILATLGKKEEHFKML
jgi:RNA-splicing ligase RtcB